MPWKDKRAHRSQGLQVLSERSREIVYCSNGLTWKPPSEFFQAAYRQNQIWESGKGGEEREKCGLLFLMENLHLKQAKVDLTSKLPLNKLSQDFGLCYCFQSREWIMWAEHKSFHWQEDNKEVHRCTEWSSETKSTRRWVFIIRCQFTWHRASEKFPFGEEIEVLASKCIGVAVILIKNIYRPWGCYLPSGVWSSCGSITNFQTSEISSPFPQLLCVCGLLLFSH